MKIAGLACDIITVSILRFLVTTSGHAGPHTRFRVTCAKHSYSKCDLHIVPLSSLLSQRRLPVLALNHRLAAPSTTFMRTLVLSSLYSILLVLDS